MIPLTVNPTVVILVKNGNVKGVSTNVAPDLKVVVVESDTDFAYESCNKPFVNHPDMNVTLGGDKS